VLEHLVYNKIINHVSNIIGPSQFGFTEKSSTPHQMLVFLDVIINNSTQIDVIYLDIQKAFDSVSHSILLGKLWSIGITGTLWAWLKNYLMDRFQKVSITNNLSKTLPVVSGVPQGSILGPILFLIYMNNITTCIQHSHLLQFSDDTKCFKTIPSSSNQLLLQEDLNALFNWMTSAHLNSKCMQVSFKSTLASSYCISGTAVTHTNTYKDLGLAIFENLSWADHHGNIIAQAYKILGLIRCTFNISHYPSAKIKPYTSLVRSQLTYCTQLWHPYLIKDILNIERVQQHATKFILNDYDSDYKSRSLQLKFLPLMYFFELQDICFTIKSLKSSTKNSNIRDYISFSTIHTRSSSCNKLIHIFHSSNLNRHFSFTSYHTYGTPFQSSI